MALAVPQPRRRLPAERKVPAGDLLKSSEDAHKKASVPLARLLSQYDMDSIAYRSDIAESRRRTESRQIALGCWIIPFEVGRPQVLDYSEVSAAVTYDI